MGKVTTVALLASTALLLIASMKGIQLLQGSQDVLSHLYWAVAAVFGGLAANLLAIAHAVQSDRMIRELRAALEQAAPPAA